MFRELDQAQASHSNGEENEPNGDTDGDLATVPGEEIPRAVARRPESWIQKIIEQIMDSPLHWVTPFEVTPVAVVAVQRYLLQDKPYFLGHKLPCYCYDVTISDGVFQEKCYLDPGLNPLVQKNILRVGTAIKISRVSFLYNEERIGQRILCIDQIHCGEALDGISLDIPFRSKAQGELPERPLRGGKSHYLALWNNEDPYGDIWLSNKQPEEYNFNGIKIIYLSQLETTWNTGKNLPALIVRILHKSKLRYYGKPDKKMIEPYQAFLEVADSSGTVSVTVWNTLCPEWYKSLNIGLVLLLRDYSIRKRFPFRMQPLPVDPQMKVISSIEICLNLHDSPDNIMKLIPEKQVKPVWKLPELRHHFLLRSELDNVPENTICDIIGIVVYAGRVQRLQKKENHEDFWAYRWIHVVDGTSEKPFIVKLFSTSQPEMFENISPMIYFVCTQLRVVRIKNEARSMFYLTTTNESRVFICGHKGQAYTHEDKIRRFIHWIKEKYFKGETEFHPVIGGYYTCPPVPETFSKYKRSLRVESFFTAISEVRKEIENLQYREQKRIAIQGIITVIKFISHSVATETTCASETVQIVNQPSTSQAAREETESQLETGERQQEDGPVSSQSVPDVCRSPGRKQRIVQGPRGTLVSVPQPEISGEASDNERDQPSCSERQSSNPLSWKSQLWKKKKHGLVDHLSYSSIYPESIPRVFVLKHKKFLTSQFNSQPAKYTSPTETNLKLEDFKSAISLDGHFEITILGLNQEIAIDVAFLPMYSPEDIQNSQVDTLLNSMNYSCVYPQKGTDKEKVLHAKEVAGDIIKAVAELDTVHVIAILDICNLGENKLEVILHRIYGPERTFKDGK